MLSISSLPLFIVGFIVFNWISATQSSFIHPILHDSLPSSHRATAMSGYSALIGLVSFGGYFLGGALIQHFDTPRAVYIVIASIFIGIVAPCTIWLASHLKANQLRSEPS
jgi:MFS family permease